MLASWANHVVIAALGLGLGGVARLSIILAPPAWDEILASRKEGEGFFRGAGRRADEQAELMRIGPRAFRLAARAQLALAAVLALTLWLSPVELGWWTLLLSVAAGALLMEFAYRLARSGRIPAGGPAFLDPLAGVELPPQSTAGDEATSGS